MLGRVFDHVGTKEDVLAEWSLPIACPSTLGRNSDIGIVVSDIHNHNLQLISAQGDLSSSSFGRMGRSPGEFLQPCQTALTADEETLAVADSGNNRIQLFDARSRCFLASCGEKGPITPGLLAAPEGIAFVEGRPEIIVADTGNNRLQIFHLEELGPIPDSRPAFVSKRDPGLPSALDEEPSAYHEVESLDSWSKYHLATAVDTGSVQDRQEAGECMGTGHRLRNERGEEGAPYRAKDTEGRDKLPHQESKTCCLLVVDECKEHSGRGPGINQPCDVAFWRPKSYFCGVQSFSAGSCSTLTAVTPFDCTAHETWVPDIPPWYRYASSQDEEALREELLSLASPHSGCPSTAISPDSTTSARTSGQTKGLGQEVAGAGNCPRDDGHEPEFREPEAGSFVVCETGDRGTLRLLVLDKQEMNNDTTDDGSHEGDPTLVSLSALSEKSFSTSTNSDWMDQLMRLGEGVPTSDGNERSKIHGVDRSKTKSTAGLSPRTTFEVKSADIHVSGRRRGVECEGRVHDSLLSLLRAYRGEGFKRLSRIADTRGPRGIVAVAERGAGRVRLLHYAPCLAPFYATELRHAHNIEDFSRPSSVSFSQDGDLIVVDQEMREVSVYSQLFGVWSPIHKFGPDLALHEAGVLTSTLQGWEQLPDNGKATGNDDKDSYRHVAMEEGMDWQNGLPIAARFFSSKLEVAVGDEAGHESEARWCQKKEKIMLLTSDGKVRIIAGARRRDCGMFAALHLDTALFIMEHLGYRSSKVLGYVNRTMARVRARLRQDWRLHPLTPFGLARVKFKFLQWGRLTSGQAVPGRGEEVVDVARRKLCDNFLKTLSCSRPACPYSHNHPRIDPAFAANNDACILFRSGVTNAVTDLYGQIFAWEWEGDLYRLFRERSFRRTLVQRRDRMALGTHGADAITITEYVEENHQVLDYLGFMEFATVVHEHVISLRSWYSRLSSSRNFGRRNNLVAAAATATEPSPTASKRTLGTTSTTDGEGEEGQRGADTSSLESSLSMDTSSHLCVPLEAAPWMSWDLLSQRSTVEHESATRGSQSPRSTKRFEEETKETMMEGNVREEPASNRIYGEGTEREVTSINQLFAFQTDRVMRVLDRITF